MKTVYLDYNVVSSLFTSGKEDKRNETIAKMDLLRENEHRFAFSAWHSFEIARSINNSHIASCCDFIESLDPVWMSNTSFVKKSELLNYQKHLKLVCGEIAPVQAINETLARMWATYGGPVLIGETLFGMVQMLKEHPEDLELVNKVASQTVDAIKIGREALKDGRYKKSESVLDEAYIDVLLEDQHKANAKVLLGDKKALFSACPSIGIEDALTSIRVAEQFKPEDGDAADMQHGIVGFGYCDYFVSHDKMLINHLSTIKKKLNLSCTPSMNFDWPLDSH